MENTHSKIVKKHRLPWLYTVALAGYQVNLRLGFPGTNRRTGPAASIKLVLTACQARWNHRNHQTRPSAAAVRRRPASPTTQAPRSRLGRRSGRVKALRAREPRGPTSRNCSSTRLRASGRWLRSALSGHGGREGGKIGTHLGFGVSPLRPTRRRPRLLASCAQKAVGVRQRPTDGMRELRMTSRPSMSKLSGSGGHSGKVETDISFSAPRCINQGKAKTDRCP